MGAADTGTTFTAPGSDRTAGNRHGTGRIDGADTGGIFAAMAFNDRGAANVDGGICGSVAAANGSAVMAVPIVTGGSINIAAGDIDDHIRLGVITAADDSAIPSVRVYFAAMDVDCNITIGRAILTGSNEGAAT